MRILQGWWMLGLLAAAGSALHAQTPREALDRELARVQAHSQVPGFCAAIVDANGLLYGSGFGKADLAQGKPYTADTRQPIASVSKTLIGVALMKAVELGYFTLDTDINHILPFEVANPAQPGRAITVRQLATHTSGIVDREDVYAKAYEEGPKPKTALKDFLSAYFRKDGRYYSADNFAADAPGTTYRYTNIGAALAGYLIEAKAGMPYAEFTKKYIFDPAGMTSSTWYTDETSRDNAELYDAKRKPYPVYSLVTYPDGGLHTSCTDLARYLSRVIAGYRGEGGPRLLARGSFRAMLEPQFDPAHLPGGLDAKHPNQGLFWEFLRGGDIGHYGGDPGVATFMAFDPKSGRGRILLANTGGEEAMTPALAAEFKAIWTALQAYAPKLPPH